MLLIECLVPPIVDMKYDDYLILITLRIRPWFENFFLIKIQYSEAIPRMDLIPTKSNLKYLSPAKRL